MNIIATTQSVPAMTKNVRASRLATLQIDTWSRCLGIAEETNLLLRCTSPISCFREESTSGLSNGRDIAHPRSMQRILHIGDVLAREREHHIRVGRRPNLSR